ncbi:MAG TPA: glycoside hydrolase family 20 zincin-like fold domain-containing protein, partial [Armatimonadota bacterium]|nr:glycoside hydrolase family 20 zincin-like fold domain-containing protein [Armatimonadota bacterium]
MLRLVLVMSVLSAMALAQPTLVPRPKEVRLTGQAISMESAVIVTGKSEPEVYAAEMLQASVKKRFGRMWPIAREGGKATIVLRTDPSLPHDGYSIEMAESKVTIRGSSPRGVVYGQDTLFQLLSKQGDELMLARASI